MTAGRIAGRVGRAVAALPRVALIGIVRGYQIAVSPFLGARCRYYPSCSAYAVTALGRFGAVRGTALTVWRLLRCNPWSRGGVDHVPAELARGRVGKPLIGTEMEPAI